jgi:hypothetical protein
MLTCVCTYADIHALRPDMYSSVLKYRTDVLQRLGVRVIILDGVGALGLHLGMFGCICH